MEILFHLQCWLQQSILMEISGDLCEWKKIQGNLLGDNTWSLPPPLPSLYLLTQSDEAVRVCLGEKGHNVLVLQRMSSEPPAPSASASGAGREEARNRR